VGVVSPLRSFPQVTDMQGLDIGFHPCLPKLLVVPRVVNQEEVSDTPPNQQPVRGIFTIKRGKVNKSNDMLALVQG